MKITPEEHASVLTFLKKNSFPPTVALEISTLSGKGYDLAKLEEKTLRMLIAKLPTDIFHRKLKSVKSKGQQTLLHIARPHLAPDSWPKIFRHINNNDRAGLRDFGGGQLGLLNDRAMSISLTGNICWNERKFGDLLIMGPWSAISAAITAGGSGLSLAFGYSDIYAGDVNVEFDRMYTDEKIPEDDRGFYVTYVPGRAFALTDEIGEVVLNPRGELVELAGGAVSGFAGGAANFSGIIEAVDTSLSTLDTAISMTDNLGVKLKGGTQDKDMHTFIVSILPAAGNQSKKTNRQVLSGSELLTIFKSLTSIA